VNVGYANINNAGDHLRWRAGGGACLESTVVLV
jgi:hypothetical protein